MDFHLHEIAKADGRMLRLYSRAPRSYTLTDELPPVAEPTRPERRFHPFRGEPVYVNPGRNARTLNPPADYNPLAAGRPGGFPTEVNVTDFEVAIFDNRWPGLIDATPPAEGQAYGRCEVVVYSPQATGTLGDFSTDRVALILQAVGDRVAKILADPRISAVVPFENRGAFIGATLPHPHGQIYALADLPPVFARQAEGFAALDRPLHRMLASRTDLVVAEDAHCLTVCPEFSRYPYETWVVPKAHVANPLALDDAALSATARALRDQVRRFDALFGAETPYVMWHAVPPRGAEGWPWHVQFWPLQRGPGKWKYLASVEQITGLYLLDVPPEAAARTLRATQPGEVME